MSTMARPRGPLPARVYWFRRFLVLGVFLALVFGVAQLFPEGGDAQGDTARAVGAETTRRPAAEPQSTADAQPVADPGPRSEGGTPADERSGKDANTKKSDEKKADKKPSKKTDEKPTKTPLPEPTGPCDNGEIVVTPKVRGEAHAGSRVRFRLDLTTTTTPACTWKVSPRSLVVKLTSGNDRIWSSQDCPGAIPEKGVVVRKEHPAKVYLGWRGQRSDSTCSRTTAWAEPGWYHINAAAFGAEPTDLQFELQQPVRPTITPSPKPEKDKKKQDSAG